MGCINVFVHVRFLWSVCRRAEVCDHHLHTYKQTKSSTQTKQGNDYAAVANRVHEHHALSALERPERDHEFDSHRLQLVKHALRIRPALRVEVPVALSSPVFPVDDNDGDREVTC